MFDSMNAVIAALHSVDYAAIGLGDFGRPGNYMGRQIARWSRQYRASETETQPAMDALIDWLPQHLPPEGAPAIVHGDYRMDNLVFHKTEPRVIGVLDWELSTIGDPLADFAYHCLTWRVTPELFRGLAGVDFAAARHPRRARLRRRLLPATPAAGDRGLGILPGLQPVPPRRDPARHRQARDRRHRRQRRRGRDRRAPPIPMGEQAWELARSLG